MKTYLLCIGVDRTDKDYYKGTFSTLNCCENDAVSFQKLLTSNFIIDRSISFINETADPDLVLFKLEKWSKKIKKGDNLIVYYSGHGSQVNDINGDEEEDNLDETWCMYDRMLIDDEIYDAFAKYEEGVKIWVILDSCHSGTAAKVMGLPTGAINDRDSKLYPVEKSQAVFDANPDMHENLKDIVIDKHSDIAATVLEFSASQSEQTALSGTPNSLYTEALLNEIQKIATSDDPISMEQLYISVLNSVVSHADNSIQQAPHILPYGNSSDQAKDWSVFDILRKKAPKPVAAYSWNRELMIEADAATQEAILMFLGENQEKFKIAEFESLEDTLILKLTEEHNAPWEEAYSLHQLLIEQAIDVFIEPNFVNSVQFDLPSDTKGESPDNNHFLSNWPSPKTPDPIFNWQLGSDFSQLRDALEAVKKKYGSEDKIPKIRIAHIDTGYYPEHPSTPKKVLKELGKSFIKGEKDNKGIEIEDNMLLKFAEQDFHGMGTIGLLAGNKIEDTDITFGDYTGYVGAIPFAEIIPIRIGDKVALLGGQRKAFYKAVKYAIKQKCDVISMSMAGAPSRLMAKAVNKAYENGIVIVSAASNNFKTPIVDAIFPEHILYPARYQRVIAATGAAYNQFPYDFDAQEDSDDKGLGANSMQGNWGPPSAMKYALAAYTPNIAWASVYKDKEDKITHYFSKAGGGTSAATPQIAAAAALYILYHKEALDNLAKKDKWKKAEAIRQALFDKANKDLPTEADNKKYYGRGILRALDALSKEVPEDIEASAKARSASETWFQFFKFLNTYNPWAKGAEKKEIPDSNLKNMLCAEFEQIVSLASENQREDFDEVSPAILEKVMNSAQVSDVLKNALQK